MPHAKFQDHRTSGSGEEDFKGFYHMSWQPCDLAVIGHVTWTIYKNFRSPFPRRFHIKFGFDWSGSFRGEDV